MKEIVAFIRIKYPQLEANIVTAATADGKLKRFVMVTRRVKVDDTELGPHDAVKLLVDDTGHYRFLVYNRLLW